MRRWSWLVAFVGAVLTIAAMRLVVRPEWGYFRAPPGGPGRSAEAGGLVGDGDANGSQPKAPAGPGETGGADGNRAEGTAIAAADEDGLLLSSASRASLSSPNGAYTLALQDDGDLVLAHRDNDGIVHPVWWTATGDNRTPGGHNVTITSTDDGRALLSVGAELHGAWRTVWHSDLEPGCRAPLGPGIVNRTEILDAGDAGDSAQIGSTTGRALILSDSGLLRLAGLCDLHVPRAQRDRPRRRSLALIVAGLYRTNNATCSSHVAHLIAGGAAFSRVDVFAHVLLEDEDLTERNRTRESVEAALRACYGGHLRGLTVGMARDAEVPYPDGDMPAPCGGRLARLNNQLRTLAVAGRAWWAWSVGEGFLHDTVLRVRPDAKFWGQGAPRFRGVAEMGDALVLPHPRGEHYFYCARMSGRVGVGPTDQLAYGAPAPMLQWLTMHDHFPEMVALASNASSPARRDFSGCEVLPSGPSPADCPRPAPCSIECLVAWYLEARGVQFEVEWGWDQGLLRMENLADDRDAKSALGEGVEGGRR